MKKISIIIFISLIVCICWYSSINISLPNVNSNLVVKVRLKDNTGVPITAPTINRYAVGSSVQLSSIPPFLITALLAAEDKRFFTHYGVDPFALLNAAWMNLTNFRVVRGGSTLSEQSARIILHANRGLYGRVLSMLGGIKLDSTYSKNEILSFYLNQVTFPSNIRGVEDGAKSIFGRELSTLTKKEILALVVMIRAPERLNPFKVSKKKIEKRIDAVLNSLVLLHILTQEQAHEIQEEPLSFEKGALIIKAPHFARVVYEQIQHKPILQDSVQTTLDGRLQTFATESLNRTLEIFKKKGVQDGAVLIVEKNTGAIRTWVSAHAGGDSEIDSVLSPRQPGSALKPFLYALAFDQGVSPSEIMDDSPLARPVGEGMKSFKNYSRSFYGPIRIREALGNSLNIPAVELITRVGIPNFLNTLHALEFKSLDKPYQFYGEGLALGNGEVTLFELVRAYRSLSRGGFKSELHFIQDEADIQRKDQIFSEATSALIADILSDPAARAREFGDEINLSIPYLFAYKTGTSTDFHDAWAVGFSDQYIVGVWIGDLARKPMNEITGSKSSAVLMRSIFTELGRRFGAVPLKTSSLLVSVEVCPLSGKLPGPECPHVIEKFPKNKIPKDRCDGKHQKIEQSSEFRITMPSPGLKIAFDPRIPESLQKIPFEVEGGAESEKIIWTLNGEVIGEGNKLLWPISRGSFLLKANQGVRQAEEVRFYVR